MADGRKNNGGPRPNSGRKSKAEELGLAGLLDRIWTLEDREQVIKALSKNASEGNEKAAALLMAYAYGKPTEHLIASITHHEFEVDIGGTIQSGDDKPAEFVN